MLKLNEEAMSKIQSLEVANIELPSTKELLNEQLKTLQQKCYVKQRKGLEDEIVKLKNLVSDKHAEIEDKNLLKDEESLVKSVSGLGGQINMQKSGKLRETLSNQRATIVKIFEGSMLAMLRSEDLDVQIQATKVIANLAADDANQEKIVEEGGLNALLLLLETSKDTMIHRVTAGAIANRAMNDIGHFIFDQVSSRSYMLRETEASTYSEHKKGKFLLIEDGALRWIITNSAAFSTSTRRHIELTLSFGSK